MRGYQTSRTKAQDLVEIRETQNGFLSGLNLDLPKSDVGDTQVTFLKNAIAFRDRIESRGGLKPSTDYLFDAGDVVTILQDDKGPIYYDEQLDELFYTKSATVTVSGAKVITNVQGGTFTTLNPIFKRINDKIYISDQAGSFFVLEDRGTDYFLRNVTSIGVPGIATPLLAQDALGTFKYSFKFSFIRIVDNIVVNESLTFSNTIKKSLVELDGITANFDFEVTASGFNLPQEFFLQGGSDNHFTHIRYYRSTLLDGTVTDDQVKNLPHFAVGDFLLNDLTTAPGSTFLNLNITDGELVTGVTEWQSGYRQMTGSRIYELSSAMLLMRNEDSPTDFYYCPTPADDDQKYIGWYNPFFQFGSGVNGDITNIQDMGSYCLITTVNKSYYIDTINKLQDDDQAEFAYTPILSDSILTDANIGINIHQRKALVKSKEGKLIGLTSDGAIREFIGYTWGHDLAKGKVHAITKGKILREDLACNGAFSNDAYYLFYVNLNTSNSKRFVRTLRLGTTEEAGFGFSEFSGEGSSESNPDDQLGWPFRAIPDNTNRAEENTAVVIKDKLFVLREQTEGSPNPSLRLLMEFTSDSFDKKINKDVVDIFAASGPPFAYQSTTYFDIATETEFPEVTASSESMFLYFLKASFFLRKDRYSFKVTDEVTTAGYQITDSNIQNVTLDDNEFGMDARAGEEDDIKGFNNNFIPGSDVVLLRDVQDHRIRLTLRGQTSGFQLTGYESHFKRHKRKDIQSTDTTDTVFDLVSGLYCYVTEILKNFAIGLSRGSVFDIGVPINGAFIGHSNEPQITGTAATIVEGPDGTQSGFDIPTGNNFYEFQVPPVANATSVTVMFWYQQAFGRLVIGWNSSELNQYSFDIDTGSDRWVIEGNGLSTQVSTFGAFQNGWTHIAFVHNGTEWLAYKNGILLFTDTPKALSTDIKAQSLRLEGRMKVSDLRMYNKVITADQLVVYNNNVVNNEGDYVNGY